MLIQEEISEDVPLVIQYTNIIHQYGVVSPEAIIFRYQYKEDKVFQRRAGVLSC